MKVTLFALMFFATSAIAMENSPQSTLIKKVFSYCCFCDKPVPLMQEAESMNLSAHLQYVHFYCDICGTFFPSNQAVGRHRIKGHFKKKHTQQSMNENK